MSTSNPTTRKRFNRRWATPLVAVTIGVAYLVAGWLGDDLFFGVFGFAVCSPRPQSCCCSAASAKRSPVCWITATSGST